MLRAVVGTHRVAAVLPGPTLLAHAGAGVAALPVVAAVERALLCRAGAAVAAPAGHALANAVRTQSMAPARLAVGTCRAGLSAAVSVLKARVALASTGRRVAGAVTTAEAAIATRLPCELVVHLLLLRGKGVEVSTEPEDLAGAAAATASV